MLGKTVMINTPSYFRAVFRAVSIFMPKSALEKAAPPPPLPFGCRVMGQLRGWDLGFGPPVGAPGGRARRRGRLNE